MSLGYLWVAFDGLRLRPEFALGVGRRRRNTRKEKITETNCSLKNCTFKAKNTFEMFAFANPLHRLM